MIGYLGLFIKFFKNITYIYPSPKLCIIFEYVLRGYQNSSCLCYIELPKYYTRLQTAVARGLGYLVGQQAGPHTDGAPNHSLSYFSSVSE